MKPIENLSTSEKLLLLEQIESRDDSYFSDRSEELKILAHDQDEEVKLRAIRCIWDFPSKSMIDLLFEILEHETNEEVRNKIISGFGRYVFELDDDELFHGDGKFEKYECNEDSIPRDDLIKVKKYLIGVFEDDTMPLDARRFALESLGFSSDDSVRHLIERAYSSGETMMRASAIFAMGRSGLSSWNPILIKELINPAREIQLEAIRACGNACVQKAGKRLIQLTHTKDREILLASIWALGQTGWEDGYDRLDELTASKDKEIKETAEAAMEEWFIAHGESDIEELF
jgi:hypothetical protein